MSSDLAQTPPATYSVRELSEAIGRAVARAFPEKVWVRGEIRDLSRPPSGHVFFTLVDPDDPDTTRIPVALFAKERQLVNRVLERSGAVRMTDGVDIRIRGQVVHYPLRGTVQIRMTHIDTDYTVGKLAAERARVLRTLSIEGLLDRNARRPIPLVPLRIGLLTSTGSAAEADFLSTIEASPYRFDVVAVDARVQGVDAVPTILSGLDRLDGAVDVVALVRGGGAASDLAAFDDERLARRIAAMTTPVFTGVGHEIDRSVADEVAARAYKTPTETAVAIVDAVAGFDRHLVRAGRQVAAAARRRVVAEQGGLAARTDRLERSSRRSIGMADQRLAVTARRVIGHVRRSVAHDRHRLEDRSRRLIRAAPRAVERAGIGLAVRRERIAALDPDRMHERGWSVTRGGDGAVLRSVGNLSSGDALVTQLSDGVVTSEVTHVTPIRDDAGQRHAE